MLNNIAMNETFQAILDSLPSKEPRSKLEPYAELIQELRKRGRSYREIASILAERCGVRVGTHTVYNFVRVRASKKGKSGGGGTGRSGQTRATPVSDTTVAPALDSNDEVWQRIQALKQRTTPDTGAEKKVFQFDGNEPLQLISDPKQKK
jgi:IS30 family transposase